MSETTPALPVPPTARVVPLYPLVGVVLLPEQRLPLHVVTSRDRAAVREALAGDAALVAPYLTDESQASMPPRAVATVGRIVAHQRLPDGRFNILVEGMLRVRIEELPTTASHRRARVSPLGDPATEFAEVSATARSALLTVTSLVARAGRAKRARTDLDSSASLPTARLAFRLVDRFVTATSWRLRVLEASTPTARVAVATEALAHVLAETPSLSPCGST